MAEKAIEAQKANERSTRRGESPVTFRDIGRFERDVSKRVRCEIFLLQFIENGTRISRAYEGNSENKDALVNTRGLGSDTEADRRSVNRDIVISSFISLPR